MNNLPTIQLGHNGPTVSKLGLGCMRMSSIWGGPTPDETESIATIHEALDRGINFLNTGDFYGAGHNELLIGRAIRGRRDDAFISVKCGAIFHNGQWIGMDLRPVAIRNFVNYSLTRLGIDTIDLYQPSRMDGSVPVADIIGTVADLVQGRQGAPHRRIGDHGRTSCGKPTPSTPFQRSGVWATPSPTDEIETGPPARSPKELGIAVIAFANTAEGLLTGDLTAPLAADDHRNHFTRFQGENLVHNLRKGRRTEATGRRDKGCTPTQLAIAWVNAQGDHIMPLVSMSRRSRLPENLAAMDITFTPEEMTAP